MQSYSFQGTNHIAGTPAWGEIDFTLSVTKGRGCKVHKLTGKLAPFSEGKRSLLCAQEELEALGVEFKANDKGNVWLGFVQAVRRRQQTRVEFAPATWLVQARCHLNGFSEAVQADALALLGGEETELEMSSIAVEMLGGEPADTPF